MYDIQFETGTARGIIDNVLIKPEPPIPFVQPYKFDKGEEFEGDNSACVDKWNDWCDDIFGDDDWIALEGITSEDSCMEHEIDVSSSSEVSGSNFS